MFRPRRRIHRCRQPQPTLMPFPRRRIRRCYRPQPQPVLRCHPQRRRRRPPRRHRPQRILRRRQRLPRCRCNLSIRFVLIFLRIQVRPGGSGFIGAWHRSIRIRRIFRRRFGRGLGRGILIRPRVVGTLWGRTRVMWRRSRARYQPRNGSRCRGRRCIPMAGAQYFEVAVWQCQPRHRLEHLYPRRHQRQCPRRQFWKYSRGYHMEINSIGFRG